MSALLDAIASWQALLVALFVFGFAPGAFLRVIVLAFDRDDPRRPELLAELHAVPRWERPFWVAEQLEVALFDGLLERAVWAATGRIIHRWHLGDGVKRNRDYPDSFWVPDEEAKDFLQPGDLVKLVFETRKLGGDRMWVRIEKMTKRRMTGTLQNSPVMVPRLEHGTRIKFKRKHIIDYEYVEDDFEHGDVA